MDRLMMAQQRRLPDREVSLMTRWRWQELKDVAKAAPARLAQLSPPLAGTAEAISTRRSIGFVIMCERCHDASLYHRHH